jgi:hypothetical protein
MSNRKYTKIIPNTKTQDKINETTVKYISNSEIIDTEQNINQKTKQQNEVQVYGQTQITHFSPTFSREKGFTGEKGTSREKENTREKGNVREEGFVSFCERKEEEKHEEETETKKEEKHISRKDNKIETLLCVENGVDEKGTSGSVEKLTGPVDRVDCVNKSTTSTSVRESETEREIEKETERERK